MTSEDTDATSWRVKARRTAQSVGIDPRYLRRLRWLRKARVLRSARAGVGGNLGFVLADPEPDNFTYALANEAELSSWVAAVARAPGAEAERYLAELEHDAELSERLREATRGRWLWSKAAPPFGKRAGWYAVARILRPELIVETGVHDGLGSLALLRALERNAEDGSPGRLVSFDINPTAGWLVGAHPMWELRIESSRTGLPQLLASSSGLGMLIHDSWHSYENERFEFSAAVTSLSPGGVLISDNVHVTRALADICAEFGLQYHEFSERPRDHFYPGGAIGAGRVA